MKLRLRSGPGYPGSKAAKQLINDGATIVDFLTQPQLHCEVGNEDSRHAHPRTIIAVNAGPLAIGYRSNIGNFHPWRDKGPGWQVLYMQEDKYVFCFEEGMAATTHPGKQWHRRGFSRLIYEGSAEDIVAEFIEAGYEEIRVDQSKENRELYYACHNKQSEGEIARENELDDFFFRR